MLTGRIPPELGLLSDVRGIIINEDAFSGTIPVELSNMPSLLIMDITTTETPLLSGTVPQKFCNLGVVNVSCPFTTTGCGFFMTCQSNDGRGLCGCDCPCTQKNGTSTR